MKDLKDINEEEAQWVERLRTLDPEQRRIVLDFIESLKERMLMESWVEFDEWARNLAKQKGFDRLTDEDVAEIVTTHRRAR
jgi:hypothetical protein